jgi:hypothetical protein
MQNPCLSAANLEHLAKAVEAAILEGTGLVLLKGHCPAGIRTFADTFRELAQNPSYPGKGRTETTLVRLTTASGLDPQRTFAVNTQFICTGCCHGEQVEDEHIIAASREFDQALIITLLPFIKNLVMIFVGDQVSDGSLTGLVQYVICCGLAAEIWRCASSQSLVNFAPPAKMGETWQSQFECQRLTMSVVYVVTTDCLPYAQLTSEQSISPGHPYR